MEKSEAGKWQASIFEEQKGSLSRGCLPLCVCAVCETCYAADFPMRFLEMKRKPMRAMAPMNPMY